MQTLAGTHGLVIRSPARPHGNPLQDVHADLVLREVDPLVHKCLKRATEKAASEG
jgi:hypothetical protein